jgi:molybdopterin-biosynthesis enzyme MoeA-like protein
MSATGVLPSSRVENKFGDAPTRQISSPMVKQVTQLGSE